MRILALMSVLIALASVTFVTATALGQDEVNPAPAPAFGEDVPRLLPMARVEPAATASPVSRSRIDELAVVAAAYWLLLGGVALRRVVRPVQLAAG